MISVKYSIYGNEGRVLYSQDIRKYGSAAIFFQTQEDADNYPTLSEITAVDIERFFPEDMSQIIQELTKLQSSLISDDDKSYIDEIIRLCKRCRDSDKGQIIFNPFLERVKFDTAKV